MAETTAAANGLRARYVETDGERRLVVEREDDPAASATVAQNRDGYAMLAVRAGGEELERYYGLAMALDHVAELLGVSPGDLPVPAAASDMGM